MEAQSADPDSPPYELGYGRSIAFNHDFIGREALEKARDNFRRTRVTLVYNADEVKDVLGADPGYLLRYPRIRATVQPSPYDSYARGDYRS